MIHHLKQLLKISLLGLTTISPGTVISATDNQLSHPPKDPGVANFERILYWLEKRGELPANASEQQKQAALKAYTNTGFSIPDNYVHKINGKAITSGRLTSHLISKASKSKSAATLPPHEVKVLTILIDFPDLPYNNNRLTANDTSMYYADYNVQHYQDLMFSPTGFTGPSNQNLKSSNQYYSEESGDSFLFNGTVYGWVTADNNAKTYGENDPDNNDSDKDAPSLIKEAITKAVAQYNIDLSEFDLIDPADLDNDGITNEPDGYIDYLMVFHSSIGEDAGGGVLGDDAIWSHRWNVNNYDIPGTNYAAANRAYRAHDYTVQPIDAAIGVVSHEFGHMVANLNDEYDTNESQPGSPVSMWSIMASGSWAGSDIPGSQPTGFSPLARSILQERFGGNWINQTTLTLDTIKSANQTLDIVEAIKHDSGINQIKIELPQPKLMRHKPFAGNYQYFSGNGDSLDNQAKFNLTIPAGTQHELSMKAYWNIEVDWDYVQVLINGSPIAGNYTKATNPEYNNVSNYITGLSSQHGNGWVDLTYDVSSYQNQTVEVTIKYSTDTNTGGYGMFIDNIQLTSASSSSYSDDAETANTITLNGFQRIENYDELGQPQNYYVQLRSHNGVDEGLSAESYDDGIVVWFADTNYSNNQVSLHPGKGFIGVVDSDQNTISSINSGVWSTYYQIRDAAFGLNTQDAKPGDNNLTPIAMFDDSDDYSTPGQPASGMQLPTYGLKMEVTEQAADSTTAKVIFSATPPTFSADFSSTISAKVVSFNNLTTGGEGWLTYDWDFGDNSNHAFEPSPSHTYTMSGDYTVTLTVTDENNTVKTSQKTISIEATPPVAGFTSSSTGLTSSFTNTSTGGDGALTYSWDFGDSTAVSTEESPTHTYAASGNYTVVLTVTDSNETSVAQQLINVQAAPAPVASFTSSVNNLSVTFNNTSTNGEGNLTYAWDFGDNSTVNTSQSPSHSYASAGTYTVTLTVTDSLNRNSSTTATVTVTTPQEPSSSGGGGGFSCFSILLLGLLSLRKQKH
ncbi:immune inhibitor A domain-containing protein [Aliikangiella sp. IMCC44359]|uniref:immune inhibitor A domain-containing protein n=1 Tax=Aliikangiella sp. IMCC44359 TaxID=3459125 RepID=UPI00403B04CC